MSATFVNLLWLRTKSVYHFAPLSKTLDGYMAVPQKKKEKIHVSKHNKGSKVVIEDFTHFHESNLEFSNIA